MVMPPTTMARGMSADGLRMELVKVATTSNPMKLKRITER